jgi:D-serine/D-alanine/glycine transporter
MPCGIVMSWVCLAFFAFVLVLLTLQPDTLQALMVTPVWFVVLAIAYHQLIRRRRAQVEA